MKILFYNWVPFDDAEGRGGGVSVYQKNLIEALVDQEVQVDYLSSGIEYSAETAEPYIRQSTNIFDPQCRSFELVNSPVISPGHSAFGWNDRLFEKGPALTVFHTLLRNEGPYDIVHFNNLEGIPFTFLELKDEFPKTLVVVSHHNYFPICPQLNLWWRETAHCEDFDQGRSCESCLVHKAPKGEILAAHQLASLLHNNGISATSTLFSTAFTDGSTVRLLAEMVRQKRAIFLQEDSMPVKPGVENSFARRRRLAIDILNRSVDIHLAVSERVARVLASYGIKKATCQVSYIGTKHGELLKKAKKRQHLFYPGELSIAFLGYMRHDKGFFFLLDTLERLPAKVARKLRVKLAAKFNNDPETVRRIENLRPQLAALEHINGYKHDDLKRLLADVDLGVIPVLWEDNLPQVALEIMSQGVPLLCSDKGGAQELGGNPDFVFPAGSHTRFADAIRRFQSGEVGLSEFWNGALGLRSMQEHIEELYEIYQNGLQNTVLSRGCLKVITKPARPPVVPLTEVELDHLNQTHSLNSWMIHNG